MTDDPKGYWRRQEDMRHRDDLWATRFENLVAALGLWLPPQDGYDGHQPDPHPILVSEHFPGVRLTVESIGARWDVALAVEMDAEVMIRGIKLLHGGGKDERIVVEYREPTLRQIAETLRLAGWQPIDESEPTTGYARAMRTADQLIRNGAISELQ